MAVNHDPKENAGWIRAGRGRRGAPPKRRRSAVPPPRASISSARLSPLFSLTPPPGPLHPPPLDPCAAASTGPLLPRLTACAPRASHAQHHALDAALLDASPPNPGTDVNEPEAALDAAAPPSPLTIRVRHRRDLLADVGAGAGDDDDEFEYEECEDGDDKDCEEIEVED